MLSNEKYVAQLREETVRRMRVRHLFTGHVRRLFIEAEDPERLAGALLAFSRESRTGSRISLAERVVDALSSMLPGEVWSPVTPRWAGAFKRLVGEIKPHGIEQLMRDVVRDACVKRAGHYWLDLAARMPHPEDHQTWEKLLTLTPSTKEAYEALVHSPEEALRYLPAHIESLPEEQRKARVRLTLDYVRRLRGMDTEALAAKYVMPSANTWRLMLEVTGSASPAVEVVTRMLYDLMQNHLPMRKVEELVRNAGRETPKAAPDASDILQGYARGLATQLFLKGTDG